LCIVKLHNEARSVTHEQQRHDVFLHKPAGNSATGDKFVVAATKIPIYCTRTVVCKILCLAIMMMSLARIASSVAVARDVKRQQV